MKVLLVNPEFPDTYWSFRHALPFEGKRCAFPPLGLMTVSALLPASWERRMVDLNVRRLRSSEFPLEGATDDLTIRLRYDKANVADHTHTARA